MKVQPRADENSIQSLHDPLQAWPYGKPQLTMERRCLDELARRFRCPLVPQRAQRWVDSQWQ